MNKPVFVISAFAANPKMSSETGIGWIFIKSAAYGARKQSCRVLVITSERFLRPVQEGLDSYGLTDVVDVVGIRLPKLLVFLTRNPKLTRAEYLIWYFIAGMHLRRLAREQDVIGGHHVTFATEIFPTPISFLPSTSLRVWGPVGAAGDRRVYEIPPITRYAKREQRTHRIRDSVSSLLGRLFSRNIDVVVTQNSALTSRFERMGRTVIEFPNVVVKDDLTRLVNECYSIEERKHAEGEPQLKLLCVGHMIARKRFEIAISALADPGLLDAELYMLGVPLPGSEDYLPRVARDLGLSDRVHFLGKVDRSEVVKWMVSADVLIHPSAREGASGVVGEATVAGLPVVCFAETGASSVLRESGSNGVIVDAGAYSSTSFAAAIVDASSMTRRRSHVWTEQRFDRFEESLLKSAFGQRRAQDPN